MVKPVLFVVNNFEVANANARRWLVLGNEKPKVLDIAVQVVCRSRQHLNKLADAIPIVVRCRVDFDSHFVLQ
jgi:hypothetical protein